MAKSKETVRRTLGSFLRQGVFPDPENPGPADHLGMNDRKGKYHLFAKIRSEKGRTGYLGPNVNPITRDTYASNLYVHMAEESLEVLLLHNPLLSDVKEIFLDLPSRLALTAGAKGQYDLLDYHDYSEINPEVGSDRVMVGNADVYRTALDRIIREAQGQKIKVRDFRVTSIKYEMEDPSRNKSTDSMTFLFMADSLCSLIGFEKTDEKPSGWIGSVRLILNELTGHSRNFVFAYDDADRYFQEANRAFERNSLYEALNRLYEGRSCSSAMTGFYMNTWYRNLEDRIASCKDRAAFTASARSLRDATYSNRVEQNHLRYCFEILEKTSAGFEQTEMMPAVYALYVAGTSIYNYAGRFVTGR